MSIEKSQSIYDSQVIRSQTAICFEHWRQMIRNANWNYMKLTRTLLCQAFRRSIVDTTGTTTSPSHRLTTFVKLREGVRQLTCFVVGSAAGLNAGWQMKVFEPVSNSYIQVGSASATWTTSYTQTSQTGTTGKMPLRLHEKDLKVELSFVKGDGGQINVSQVILYENVADLVFRRFEDDFEDDINRWNIINVSGENKWHITTHYPRSGTYSIYFGQNESDLHKDDVGHGSYGKGACYIRSKKIKLPSSTEVSEIKLRWWNYLNCRRKSDYDIANVTVYSGRGTVASQSTTWTKHDWTQLQDTSGKLEFTGESEVDITTYAGADDFEIEFFFNTTDDVTTSAGMIGEGWFVDDVAIECIL